ncbi:hypothetical protein KCU65_g58, partial [Aureobasidium melanogenum]
MTNRSVFNPLPLTASKSIITDQVGEEGAHHLVNDQAQKLKSSLHGTVSIYTSCSSARLATTGEALAAVSTIVVASIDITSSVFSIALEDYWLLCWVPHLDVHRILLQAFIPLEWKLHQFCSIIYIISRWRPKLRRLQQSPTHLVGLAIDLFHVLETSFPETSLAAAVTSQSASSPFATILDSPALYLMPPRDSLLCQVGLSSKTRKRTSLAQRQASGCRAAEFGVQGVEDPDVVLGHDVGLEAEREANDLSNSREYKALAASAGGTSFAMSSTPRSQMAGWYSSWARSLHFSLQKTTSQSGHATTSAEAGSLSSGRSALHASHKASWRRLFAVRSEVSDSAISPGAMSSFAKTPNCVTNFSTPSPSVNRGSLVALTSSLGATFSISAFKNFKLSSEQRSGSCSKLVKSELEAGLVVLVGLCLAEPVVDSGMYDVQSRLDGRVLSEEVLGLEAVLSSTSLATDDVKTLGKQCVTTRRQNKRHQTVRSNTHTWKEKRPLVQTKTSTSDTSTSTSSSLFLNMNSGLVAELVFVVDRINQQKSLVCRTNSKIRVSNLDICLCDTQVEVDVVGMFGQEAAKLMESIQTFPELGLLIVAFKRAMASSILWKEKASSADDMLVYVVAMACDSCTKIFGQACMQLWSIFPWHGELRETRRGNYQRACATMKFRPMNTSCFCFSDGLLASAVSEAGCAGKRPPALSSAILLP